MGFKEQRKHQRFQAADQNIHAKIVPAKILKIPDISIGSTLLQTDARLNISKEYTIRIEHNGKLYPLKGSIVWSILKECKRDLRGNYIPIYHSNMQFLHVSEEIMRLILLIGTRQKKQDNDAISSEEYYPLNIDTLDISNEERSHIEARLSSIYG